MGRLKVSSGAKGSGDAVIPPDPVDPGLPDLFEEYAFSS
jgi:hypothetical protein